MFENLKLDSIPWMWVGIAVMVVAVLGWIYMTKFRGTDAGSCPIPGMCGAPIDPAVQFAPEAQVMHYEPDAHPTETVPTSITCIVNEQGEQVCSAPE